VPIDQHESPPSEKPLDPVSVVDRAYELISFGAGGAPAWDAFRALFVRQAALALRVFPGDAAVTVMNMDAYVAAQMRHGLSDAGYTEIPGARQVHITGDIAVIHQDFTMQFATGDPVPALDVFSLCRIDGQWRIVSIVSDMRKTAATEDFGTGESRSTPRT
jgi:hypothetical protein